MATSTERQDPFDGIMLAAHIDVLFDGGSFVNQDDVIVSNRLDYETYKALNLPGRISPYPDKSLEYLERHRSMVFEDYGAKAGLEHRIYLIGLYTIFRLHYNQYHHKYHHAT